MEDNVRMFSPAPWKLKQQFGNWKVFDLDGDVIGTFARKADAELFMKSVEAFNRADTMQYRLARHRDRLNDDDREQIAQTRKALEDVGMVPCDPSIDDYEVDIDWVNTGSMRK